MPGCWTRVRVRIQTIGRAILTPALVSSLAIGACLQSFADTPRAECGTLLPQIRKSGIPDVALAVFAHGSVTTAYCTLGPDALRPDAIFEAASLSKPVFAAAVLTLVESGRLDLDRPLYKYLPEYRHSENPFSTNAATDVVTDPRIRQVTARTVLSHTAGLPNWARGPLKFQSNPGARWSYSAEGYVYLQRVVETIIDNPLDVFVKQAVLAPLGMKNSSFVWEPEYASWAVSGHAVDGRSSPIAHYPRAVAASTLYTTLNDYSRFISAMLAAQPGTPYKLEETQQVVVSRGLSLGWGLGVAMEDSSGSIFHWGANPGFQSMFFLQPGKQRGILFLTDSDNGLDLVDSIVNRYVPGSHPALHFPMLHPKD